MKKETYYFPHDYNARNDIKIQALLVEHGALGYGVFWVIVEMLHEETTRQLMLDELTFVAIARQSSLNVEEVKAIVACCLKYKLFTEEDGYFFSNRVLVNIDKRIEISEKRSKAGRVSAKRRKEATCVEYNSTHVEESPTHVEENATHVEENPTSVQHNPTSVQHNPTSVQHNPTSVQHNPTKDTKLNDIKVNDTKLNDTKVNDTIVEETKIKKDENSKPVSVFNFRKALLDYGFHEELVDEWLIIRENKRSINTEFAYNSFIAEVERAGVEKNELMRMLAENQWAKFDHAWITNTNNNLNGGFINEKDRQAIESAERKQEIDDFARASGMYTSEPKPNTKPNTGGLW